jgi:hypothetical protein
MSVRKAMSAEVKIADDFTNDEIRTHSERSLAVIGTLHNEWPGLVKLPSSDKSGNLGKLVSQLAGPLTALFDAMTPKEGDDPQKREAKARLAAVFDTMLGAQDRGKDPLHFEAALMLRRLERAQAELRIAEALDEARERFADDAMNTGEMVIEPGLRALEVARTAASTNPEFRSLLAPVLDGLGGMTKKARQYRDEARKAAKDAADTPAGPGEAIAGDGTAKAAGNGRS